MFIKPLIGALLLAMCATILTAAQQGAKFFTVPGYMDATIKQVLQTDAAEAGYVLSDPHERINDVYMEKYGVSVREGKPNDAYDPDFKITLENLGFFSLSNDEALRELLLKAPQLGGFSPFTLLVYQKKGDTEAYVGHLMPETMLDITGVEDQTIRDAFSHSFDALDRIIGERYGNKEVYVSYKRAAAAPMMEYRLKFDRSVALDDFVDAFQERFEAAFEEHQFIIAGYKSYSEAYADLELPFDRYDRYWVYSLCHFVFSYNIFNKGRPDAGVFAPCSMYMYIEKGSDTLHIGMPALENWENVMGITDPAKVQRLKDIEAEIMRIMTDELGATKQ